MERKVRIKGSNMEYREKDLLNVVEYTLSDSSNLHPSQKGMVGIAFTAFSLEAYINYLGNIVVEGWGLIERKLSAKGKLKMISMGIGFDLDMGGPPFRSVKPISGMRDGLAHLKPKEEVIEQGESRRVSRRAQFVSAGRRLCVS